MTHICVSTLITNGSDNGLSPGRHQARICTNSGSNVNRTLRNKLQWNFDRIHTFSFKKMHLKMSSGKWRPFCVGFSALKYISYGHKTIQYWIVCGRIQNYPTPIPPWKKVIKYHSNWTFSIHAWRSYTQRWLRSLTMKYTSKYEYWDRNLDSGHIDGLVLERRNSIANALELRRSCPNPSIWFILIL